jgi:hypothetical protein
MASSFVNELGNDIKICITQVQAVQISISGPNSSSTNLLTLREAERLKEELIKVLK